MPRQEAREQAGIDIVSATGGEANEKSNTFAFVEG
jgi:hypothetical protein